MFNIKNPTEKQTQKWKHWEEYFYKPYRLYVKGAYKNIKTTDNINDWWGNGADIYTKKALYYCFIFWPTFFYSIKIDYTFEIVEPDDFINEWVRKFENAVEIFLNNEGNNGNTTFTGAVSQFIDILKTRQFKLKQMYQSQVLAEQSRIKLEQWHSQQTRFIKWVEPQILTHQGWKYVWEIQHPKPEPKKEKTHSIGGMSH